MPVPSYDAAAWRDLTIPLPHLASLALRWTLGLAVLLFVPYALWWGLPSLPGWGELPAFLGRVLLYGLLFVLVYAASAAVHEGLHAVAMRLFAGVPWQDVHFAVRLREGIAYVHTAHPMTAAAYRGVLLLPGLVQGVLPAVVGLVAGHGWLLFYGYVMLASAAGDLAMLWLLRPLDGSTRVRDHPTQVGCQVYAAAQAPPPPPETSAR